MMEFIKSALTTSDNKTADIIRICFFMSFVAYLILQLLDYQEFSPTTFASGLAILFTSASGSLLLKKDTEPS